MLVSGGGRLSTIVSGSAFRAAPCGFARLPTVPAVAFVFLGFLWFSGLRFRFFEPLSKECFPAPLDIARRILVPAQYEPAATFADAAVKALL